MPMDDYPFENLANESIIVFVIATAGNYRV